MTQLQFGTDGWRAIIGREFTFENVEKMAQAYSEVLTSKISPEKLKSLPPIPLGFDRRFLSEDFAKAFASVLIANGFEVLFSKTYCPTPCISWMTKDTQSPGSVIVTASHNPCQWNGIKFKESYGGSASAAITSPVEEKIRAGITVKKISFDDGVSSGKIKFFDPFEKYVRQLQSQVDLSLIQKSNWKIAYDPLFGAGSSFLARVLEQPLEEIHAEANPGFAGLNPEPIEKNLKALMNLVSKNSSDVGLATDGDADRIGAVDEMGWFVNPHQIFALLLEHLLEKGLRGDVIKTVSTTQMIDRIAARHHLTVHEVPIGFKHICAKFLETTPLIGGEESGGIGIPSHVYERDGLLCALLLLERMSLKKKRLGELLSDMEKEMGPLHFQREDVHLKPENLVKIRESLPSLSPHQIHGLKVQSINRMDGVKFLLEGGSWLLLRPSGTEPLVRVYAESSSPTQVAGLIQEGLKLI